MKLNPKDTETAIKLLQKELSDKKASIVSIEKKISILETTGGGGIAIETDPTVPSWAKQSRKPYYSASEIGAVDEGSAITIAELSGLF